jgi:hypothetical protein
MAPEASDPLPSLRLQQRLLFQVDVQIALAVRHRELRPTAKVNRPGQCPVAGVQYRDVVAVAIHHVDAFRQRLEDDGIRLFANFDFRESLKSPEVKRNNRV